MHVRTCTRTKPRKSILNHARLSGLCKPRVFAIINSSRVGLRLCVCVTPHSIYLRDRACMLLLLLLLQYASLICPMKSPHPAYLIIPW